MLKSVHLNFNTAVLVQRCPLPRSLPKPYTSIQLLQSVICIQNTAHFEAIRGRGWNKKICSPYYRVFTHQSFMSSSLLGLWRPFLCSRVFCGIFSFDFWLHEGTFRSRLESQNHRASNGQHAILICLSTWTYSSLCPTPTNTYTKTMACLWTTRQTCQGWEIWENVFNPGLMHKLIV